MKRMLVIAAAALTMMCSSAAMARVDVGISIGIPGIIYSEPDYYYPPVRYVERPPVIVYPERVYGPVYPRYYRHYYRDHRDYKKYRHNRHDWDDHRGHGRWGR